MLRLPTLPVMMIAALAWPAGAATDTRPPPNRGAAVATAVRPTAPLPRPRTPLHAPPTASPSADEDACRAVCAQSFYFCATPDQGGNCGASWSQCAAACDTPNLVEGLPKLTR